MLFPYSYFVRRDSVGLIARGTIREVIQWLKNREWKNSQSC